MRPEEIRLELARLTRARWPGVSRASELPFPDYWRAELEWLDFHAPHIGDRLMRDFVDETVDKAWLAQQGGHEPKASVVSSAVRGIWERALKARKEEAG